MTNPYADPAYTPNYLLRELLAIRKRACNLTATTTDRENAEAITERLADVFEMRSPYYVYICHPGTFCDPVPHRVMMFPGQLVVTPIEIIPAHSLEWPAKVEAGREVAR